MSSSSMQPNTRISPPYITKFEKIKLISTRAVQISKDAPVFTSLSTYDDKKTLTDAIQIAEKEYREKKLPLGVRRVFPDGRTEDFFLKDFKNIET